eukprot:CAMPEP_0184304832 /NCGR_PEP_ID=MMETSP1049-20130417/14255_1 /TAXON_ID=77928 /ORGANISM="Proteomonas sulcata, Strain CCMP704" /LENGTH=109 /DNA_ID=CAMNT_0026616739 /DNA_START=145 /DNA_END=474 /DNA_ORIENTATION=-
MAGSEGGCVKSSLPGRFGRAGTSSGETPGGTPGLVKGGGAVSLQLRGLSQFLGCLGALRGGGSHSAADCSRYVSVESSGIYPMTCRTEFLQSSSSSRDIQTFDPSVRGT